MNVLQSYWFYLPVMGGNESLMNYIGTALAKEGHNCVIVTGAYPGMPDVEEERKGLIVYRTSLMNRFEQKMESRELEEKLVKFLSGIIKKHKIDVIHAHGIFKAYIVAHTLAFYRVAMENNVPIVMHDHDLGRTDIQYFVLTKLHWNRILTVSKVCAADIYEHGGEVNKIKVVYNAVDPTRFKPGIEDKKIKEKLGVKSGEKLFVSPMRAVDSKGEIQARKGFFTIMKALSLLKEEGLAFKWFFSGGNYGYDPIRQKAIKKVKDFARLYKIEENCVIGTVLDHEEIPALYAASDLVLHPSSDEPFGLVTIEGMAAGKVVIGANSGATPEIIRDGENGVMIEPDNYVQLANRIRDLINDEKECERIGLNARRTVEERFSIKKMIKELVKVYEGARK
ncbi:MAG: glycosyltransferase family 4 protein [Candidatus Micrarchaeota archaeon]